MARFFLYNFFIPQEKQIPQNAFLRGNFSCIEKPDPINLITPKTFTLPLQILSGLLLPQTVYSKGRDNILSSLTILCDFPVR